MSAHCRARLLLAVVAVAGACLPAAADDVETRLAIPTHRGVEVFQVDEAGAARSGGSRVNEDLAGKDGVVPAPTAGYELTSSIIVRMREVGARPGVGGRWAGVVTEAVESLPGFWMVTAPSIREAAELAGELRGDAGVAEAYLDLRRPQPLRTLPPDPGVAQQWHLSNDLLPEADLNPAPAWKAGYTGAGVTVGVIEDGWHTTHPDLAANFNLGASQTGTAATSHGTSVAGCIAAAAGNGIGGVGIAYGARVSRLYRGSSAANAAAFLFRNDLNAVKNNSWGPLDNGVATSMTSMEREALAQSAAAGRGGLGTVHLWAAGNGGTGVDRVDYDPYASSRFTIAVGALDDDDDRANYSEPGASVVVVAHSSGNSFPNRGLYTTSGTSGYTANFGGTSASSPLAAGVVAMMLEARPGLTWRDVQHVLIRSARRCDPDNPGWETNGAGLAVSYEYGFGAVDAAAAVGEALSWRLAPAATMVRSAVQGVSEPIPDQDAQGLASTIEVAEDLRLEAVEVELTVVHPFVGDLRIELASPAGTRSLLASPRFDPGDDYTAYVFTTFRHWDERGAGEWTLRIADEAANDVGAWVSWRLTLHGTGLCAADWNDDRAVNSLDISGFLTAWLVAVQTGSGEADFNGDGAVNSGDISAFLTAWLGAVGGGC